MLRSPYAEIPEQDAFQMSLSAILEEVLLQTGVSCHNGSLNTSGDAYFVGRPSLRQGSASVLSWGDCRGAAANLQDIPYGGAGQQIGLPDSSLGRFRVSL